VLVASAQGLLRTGNDNSTSPSKGFSPVNPLRLRIVAPPRHCDFAPPRLCALAPPNICASELLRLNVFEPPDFRFFAPLRQDSLPLPSNLCPQASASSFIASSRSCASIHPLHPVTGFCYGLVLSLHRVFQSSCSHAFISGRGFWITLTLSDGGRK